ncbi:hypothetical protein [Streptomyces sp. NPDC058653]|uniref:hypothetical protein n=1 Tax=Streptomyces sp. NPDC058653 TaxID=3346576 RepID=UPI00365D7F21
MSTGSGYQARQPGTGGEVAQRDVGPPFVENQAKVQKAGMAFPRNLSDQTLRNYAWVGRRFEHHRRRDTLSFAHHAEVTRLSPPEQDLWLGKAEAQKWSRNELRRAVRAGPTEQRHEPEIPSSRVDQSNEAPSRRALTSPGTTTRKWPPSTVCPARTRKRAPTDRGLPRIRSGRSPAEDANSASQITPCQREDHL